jgi:hypothetical protein
MSHSHSSSCGCSESTKIADSIKSSLYPAIIIEELQCFNEREQDMVKGIVVPFDKRLSTVPLLSAEDDCELLLIIPFRSAVNIATITMIIDENDGPTNVRLFTNRNDLDLSSIADVQPLQIIQLQPDDDGYLDYPLK